MNLSKQFFFTLAVMTAITFTFSSCKKEGCTDPTATNYLEEAKEDDGSCEYPDPKPDTSFAKAFTFYNNRIANPGISEANPVPSNAMTGDAPTDAFFDKVSYTGAFGSNNWANGWTLLYGYNPPSVPAQTQVVTDNGNGTGTTTWTNDKVWILDGLVFVNPGQTLTIEEGTIIKGKPGQGENASALVVAKGGKLMAMGAATAPIIFTYEGDPLDGTTPKTTDGQWGGIIILGNAKLNSSPGTTAIEGISTSETRGIYGGTNDADNSGTLKYISIRHGGTDIGAGNEINGLTLGGVGSGTTFDYIEIIGNKDDGVEFFGGTAQTKHIVVAYSGDDSYDYDEGFRGKGQFWYTVQAAGRGDRGGEHDGGTDPETAQPYAHPVIYNATYIGNGSGRAITFRDNAAGEYHNSIFVNWDKGIDIEDLKDGEDSYQRYLDEELILKGNVFHNIKAGNTAETIFVVSR